MANANPQARESEHVQPHGNGGIQNEMGILLERATGVVQALRKDGCDTLVYVLEDYLEKMDELNSEGVSS